MSYTKYRQGYIDLWNKMSVTKTVAANKQADAVIKARSTLEAVERETGVPWYVVGCMQLREAGMTGNSINFKGVLHNGQEIVGTGRKTSIVPAGRGPFADWHSSAIDALKLKGYMAIKDWDNIARVCYVFEGFNGYGYHSKGIPSPYLWGGTSVQQRGKYVADHVYDSNTMDTQLGAMAVYKTVLEKVGKVEKTDPAKPNEVIVKPTETEAKPSTPGQNVGVFAAIGAAVFAGWNYLWDYKYWWIGGGLAAYALWSYRREIWDGLKKLEF